MNANIESARKQLSDLATLAAQTERMERAILAGAEGRLKIVEGELKQLPASKAFGDKGAAKKYQELIEERGLLEQVILKARAVLREN